MNINSRKKIHALQKELKKDQLKNLCKSFFIKKKDLVVNFIPLNSIKSTSCNKQFIIMEAKSMEVFPPKKIGEIDRKINVLRKPINIYHLKNVSCCPNATFFLDQSKKNIFYEPWHDDEKNIYIYRTSSLLDHSQSLAKIKNQQTIHHYKKAIFLGGTFTFNYYHYLLEILAKTQFFDKIPDTGNKSIIIDESIKKTPSLKELTSFFIKEENIIYLNQENYHYFPEIWHITSPNYTIPNIIFEETYKSEFTKISNDSLQYLRKTIFTKLDHSKINLKPVKKLFITRRSTARQYNEDEILKIAQSYGFQGLYFEDLNIHEQIFIFNNADYIISPSGAAWTNLIFAKKGACGLSWLSNHYKLFSGYSTIAKKMNFNLHFFFYPSNADNIHGSYQIDPSHFHNEMRKLLNRPFR